MKQLWCLLLACGLWASMVLAAGVKAHTFQTQSLGLAACEIKMGKVTLGEWFDPRDTEPLSIEAQAAVGLIADPPKGIEEQGCSGGRCIVRVDSALYPIRIARPGRYVRWSRGFFPQSGGWCHSESIDYGEETWTPDCDGSTAGRWVWVKGPTYELDAGVHVLWLHNWHGGARLDKLVLAPEGSTESQDLGPPALPRTPAREGWVVTETLTIPGLVRLAAVTWPAEPRGGKVELSQSSDGRRTWAPLGAELQPTTPVPEVRLRARLTRGPDGTSPQLESPTLSYQLDPAAFAVMENEAVRVTLLRATAGVVGLLDKRSGVECVHGSDAAPPLHLRHLPPGEKTPADVPDDQLRLVALAVANTRATARYRVADGAEAVVRLDLEGTELKWGLTLENQSSLDIVEVSFPLVRGVRLGEASADDLLAVPDAAGGHEVVDPARWGGGMTSYPAGGGMAWVDLYEREPSHGLYLSCHDPTLLGCRLGATAEPGSDKLALSVTKLAHVRPGRTWEAPTCVMGVHQGDWHAAADAYREWAETWMQPPATPEWVREADGWLALVVSADSNRIDFRHIPDSLKAMRELGTHYIQVWGQMTGGSNCDALPFPNPVLGTEEDFCWAIREVQRWGGYITFYVSSQFWRVDYGDQPMLGSTPRNLLPEWCPLWDWGEWRDYAIRGYDGSFLGDSPLTPEEQARYGTPWRRTVMCPYTEAWAKRHLLNWCVTEYGGKYGANGIYLDETIMAGERMCFANNHGHEDHGIWGASLCAAVRDMVQQGRQLRPDWMFAVEGCGDAIGQWADVHLISPASARRAGHWGAHIRFRPELFRYTFPHLILYDGIANGLYGVSAEDVFLNAHLLGNRYDSFSVQPAAPLIALRQRTKQVQYRARFMDDLGVSTTDPTVQAELHVLTDDANDLRLVTLVNRHLRTGVGVHVEMGENDGWCGYRFELGGAEGPVTLSREGSKLSFEAPPALASTVLLCRRCEPLIHVPVVEAVSGEATELKVMITNVASDPVKGRLFVEAQLPGITTPDVAVELQGQSSRHVSLPLRLSDEAPHGCIRGHVQFAGENVTVRRPFQVLVRAALEVAARPRRDQVGVCVKNRSRSDRQGTVTCSSVLWPQAQVRELSVPGGGEQRLFLPLPWELTEPVEIRAEVQSGAVAEIHRVTLLPLLQNGGFEHVGADGLPRGWQYQNGHLAAMDTDRPAEGAACLRLCGEPGVFLEAHQTMPVEQGITYEARCLMRRSGGNGRTVGPCVVLFLATGGERYMQLQPTGEGGKGEWREYKGRFTVTEDVRSVSLYLYNVDSECTAWYDGAFVGEADAR